MKRGEITPQEIDAKKLKNNHDDEELLTQGTCKLSHQDKENIPSVYSEASTVIDTNGEEKTGKAAAVADAKPAARTRARVPLGELPVSDFCGLEEEQLVSLSTYLSSSSTDEIDNQSDKDEDLATKNASYFHIHQP
jgi:hypothetical protein